MKLFPLAQLLGLMLCIAGAARSATLEVDAGRSRIQVQAKATGHAFTGTLEDYSGESQRRWRHAWRRPPST